MSAFTRNLRRIVLLFSAYTCLSGASMAADATATAESTSEFLLASATKDFTQSGSPRPAGVRNVRMGSLKGPDGRTFHLMCGQFLSTEPVTAKQWMAFATIQTSDYEQWLGNQAASYCAQPKIKWLPGDHTQLLQKRLQAQPEAQR